MFRNLALATALAVLVGAGSAAAQIVPATPPGGAVPPAAPGGGGIVPGPPPGPPPAAETQNDKEFKALLVGTWRLMLQAPPGWTAYIDGTYNADGTFFSRQVSISPNGTSEATSSGTYAVRALDRSNFTLTLTYATPLNTPAASATLTYVDQNTLYNSRTQSNATRMQ